LAFYRKSGKDNLEKRLIDWRLRLIGINASVQAYLDFEELELELENLIQSKVAPEIISLKSEIDEIIDNSLKITLGDLRSQKVAIVGPPNSGKSSLINFICGDQVSIVSDLEGTTRDPVEKSIVHLENEFKLVDLAGLRNLALISGELTRHDKIEVEGVRKAMEISKSSERLIVVIDCEDLFFCGGQATIKQENLKKYDMVEKVMKEHLESGRELVVILNKSDLLVNNIDVKENEEIEFLITS
jgi:tRNA modification GTPase